VLLPSTEEMGCGVESRRGIHWVTVFYDKKIGRHPQFGNLERSISCFIELKIYIFFLNNQHFQFPELQVCL
jgi:hypothetical protein